MSICPWIGVKLSTLLQYVGTSPIMRDIDACSNVSYQLVSWELSAPQLHREPARPCMCRGWDWRGCGRLFYNDSWQFEWVFDVLRRWEYKTTIARRKILININGQLRTLIKLPMLYERTHEFPWYFCVFIRFSNRRWNSRLIPRLTPAAQPCRLVYTSCPPRTASRRVHVHTTSDRRHGHSIEYTRSCNVSSSLPRILWYWLSTGSSPVSHVSI
jgi:hypothetical protein